MSTIEINGTTWFDNEEVNKRVDNIKKSSMIVDPVINFTDEANVIGIGSISLNGHTIVCVRIEFLNRAIKMLKAINPTNEEIHLCIKKDEPFLIGAVNNKKNNF